MSSSLACPLCGLGVAAAALEAHLRLDLDYAPFVCRLCRTAFPDPASVHAHYEGPFAAHPGRAVSVLEARSVETEARLAQLLRSAGAFRGPPCGRCDDPGPKASLRMDHQSPDLTLRASPALKAQERLEPEPSERRPSPQLSSEAESPPLELKPLVAVKAELAEAKAEAKAEVFADGKVACLLCESRWAKRNFREHVARSHLSTARFLCNHCPYQAKQKVHMEKHAVKTHALGKAEAGAWTEVDLREEIEAGLLSCFGSIDEIPSQTKTCRSCKAEVPAPSVRHHILSKHLRKTVHQCLLCDFASAQLSPNEMGRHLAKLHSAALGPETCRSDDEALAPIVKKMIANLFA